MKILLLSTGGKIGGEETFTRNLALSLMKHGHSVEVGVGGEVQKQDLEARGISICQIDITSRKPVGLFTAAKRLHSYISDNGFDVVHAQAVGPAIMGVLAKKFGGCKAPWIWHNHGITDFAYKHIVRHLNSLDAIIANSDYVRELLKSHRVNADIIRRVHNGICVNDFAADAESARLSRIALYQEICADEDDKIIIYVGRLSPEKGVEVLLKAFELLYADMQNARCVIVGDGIQKADLLSQISNYKSKQNIHFLGFRKDIKELVSASDVLVLPSHTETFSLTTLQAFAAGTPCVASDVGGTPEQILDKFNGLLFKDGDYEKLASEIKTVISDGALHYYLVKNAKELCESYLNTDRMTEDIEKIYVELTGK